MINKFNYCSYRERYYCYFIPGDRGPKEKASKNDNRKWNNVKYLIKRETTKKKGMPKDSFH